MHALTSACKALLAPAESEIIRNDSAVPENTNNENNSTSVAFNSDGVVDQQNLSKENNNERFLKKRSIYRRRNSSNSRGIEEVEEDSSKFTFLIIEL